MNTDPTARLSRRARRALERAADELGRGLDPGPDHRDERGVEWAA